MADVKVIIKIPEEVYKSIQDNDYCGISNSDMYNAIVGGTPLPKNTKRIVDADKLYYKKMYFEGSYKSDVVVFAKDIDKKSIMI